MIRRLAWKNMKKSMSDEVIYFVTLIVGICMYYMFCAVLELPVVGQVFEEEPSTRLELELWDVLPAARLFVLAVFAGVIAYANRFLMKRRNKEFGIYLLLGMKKRTIAGILFAETVLVGGVSLVVGIGTGIVLSQGMDVLIRNVLAADLSEVTFAVSWHAVRDTLFSFLILYVLVYVIHLLMVGKLRLIELMHAGTDAPRSRGSLRMRIIVFVIAVAMLAYVYVTVTVRLDTIVTPGKACVLLVLLAAGTFFLFWSLSGILLAVASLSKSFYLRGIHAFTVREISSRFHTNVLAGSLICFLMFVAMSLVNSCFALCHTLDGSQAVLAPVDVCFEMSCAEEPAYAGMSSDAETVMISEVFEGQGIDAGMFRDATEFTVYEYYEWDEQEQMSRFENDMLFFGSEVMKLSDYNRLAALYGFQQHTLADDEYFVVSNRKWHRQWGEKYYLQKNHVITLGGVDYHPKYKECQDGFYRLEYIPDNFGFMVVPDTAGDANLHPETVYYAANYAADTAEEAAEMDGYVQSDEFFRQVMADKRAGKRAFAARYKSEVSKKRAVVIAVILYLGLYLGILCVAGSGALFSLKELTQAADSRRQYRTFRFLGVEKSMLRRSLFFQNAVFFWVPFAVAALHAAVGSLALTGVVSELLEIEIGNEGMLWSFGGTMGVMLGVYALYFVLTCRGCLRVREEMVCYDVETGIQKRETEHV